MEDHPQSSSLVEYTSLKDILPWQKSLYNYERGDSWRQIPIKDPLLQHAAWAYLLPIASEVNNHKNRNLLKKLRDKCGFCLYNCFGVWSNVSNFFVKHDDNHENLEDDFDDEIGMMNHER